MHGASKREPAVGQLSHPTPWGTVALAASPQRPEPRPRDLGSERRHSVEVAWDAVIAEVSPNNATQPLSLLWNGQVLAPPQFDLHIPQLCLHPLSRRLTLQLKPSLAMLQQPATGAIPPSTRKPPEAPFVWDTLK
jgi:hypothetical protein